MKADRDLENIKKCVQELRDRGKILSALLFGSQANGSAHARSDIDLGIYLPPMDQNEEVELIDKILMGSEIPISILRLDDDDESPLIVQMSIIYPSLIGRSAMPIPLQVAPTQDSVSLVESRNGSSSATD